MITEIEIEIRSVYGRMKAYPVNDLGKRIADLLETKTLTKAKLQQLQAIGFTIKVEPGRSAMLAALE